MESDSFMGMEFPSGVMKRFWNEIGLTVAQHWEYTMCHCIVCL